jgi:eukaryotic-like serine/threonine-protein kinase
VKTARTLPVETAPPGAGPCARGDRALGRYRLARRLGAGGFGVVWEAQDERLGRSVAVKRVPLPRGDETAARASREALAAARLSHAGIVALYEAAEEDGVFVLVSELVPGPTLAELLERGGVDDELTLVVGFALCEALGHAHARGVVHRDVKPANIIVCEPGAAVPVKLTDFGVAWLADEESLTVTGDVLGTFAYMAPEQADGRPVDERTDLYSLAIVLYECLTGSNPVRGRNAAATARRVGRRLPALSRTRPDLPAQVCLAIDRAADPDPARRGDLQALRAALGRPGAPQARPPEEPLPAARPRAREWAVRLAGAALAGAVCAGVLVLLRPAPAPPPLGTFLAAALAVAVLPRLGWVAAVCALATWLAASAQPGAALLILAASLPVCLALWSRPGPAWSLPALAPLLGLAGLAGAYPAFAARAAGTMRRALAGALGAFVIALAEPLAGRALWLGPAVGSGAGPAVRAHLAAALGDGISPALCPGTLAAAALWALAAASLPYLVRGAAPLPDLLAGLVWCAVVAAGALALGSSHGWGLPGHAPHGLALGLALGAVLSWGAAAAGRQQTA